MTDLIRTKTTGYIRSDIARLLQPLGGVGAFFQPGDKILIKPNFNTADPFPASTDMGFLEAVVQLLLSTKPGALVVGESCTIIQHTEEVMEKVGVRELSRKYPIEVVNFDKGKYLEKTIPGKYLRSIRLPALLEEGYKIITLPCLKTHRIGRFTMSLKIGVGLVKKTDRIALHARHFEAKVAEINLAYQPTLIILDGRQAFVTDGPMSGELVEPGIFLAGTDRVALDVEAVKILQSYRAENRLGHDPWRLPQIKRAAELGLGAHNENDYRVLEV